LISRNGERFVLYYFYIEMKISLWNVNLVAKIANGKHASHCGGMFGVPRWRQRRATARIVARSTGSGPNHAGLNEWKSEVLSKQFQRCVH